MYETFRLADAGVPSAAEFSQHFITVNKKLWADYDQNLIEHSFIRQHRFPMVYRSLGIDEAVIEHDLNAEYLRLLPRKPHLLPATREMLDYLKDRYVMHIITNGFAEIQAIKMDSAEIAHYFNIVVTSENANAKKPDPLVFAYAMQAAGADVSESLMIGDNFVADILGAKRVGMDTVFYNPARLAVDDAPTYDIQHWQELMTIL